MTITATPVERGYDHAPPHFVQRKSKQEWRFVIHKKVLIAHPPTSLLRIALRSAINEWPQTVWRPVEHCFGFVCQGFGLRIIRKLGGIVSWYFDYHAATLQKERWRSISLNCSIRNKRWTTGGGPREFLYVSLIVYKLLRDVLGVCSKVDTLYYSTNGKREGRPHTK
jgi:hypothetical protein